MNLVVVESPAKAKTINKYLGPSYQVLASYGHVRDLPAKDGSVNPDNDFAMLWQVEGKAEKHLAEIAKALKSADRLILATDPDREGEAISWHVLEELKGRRAIGGKPVERVVFNAVTRDAVLDAMRHPRVIDDALVDAYLARRALDYLVGFTLSPVLWRKLPGARSAGRVQSVALRLVCDRETEIESFKPREYWSVTVTLEPPGGGRFVARVTGFDGKKIARLDIADQTMARRIEAALKAGQYRVAAIEAKPVKRHPSPPFTTSTLQQEASRQLGFAPARTMQVAQRLYEDGLITYMRTDGVQTAPEAIAAARRLIASRYGDRYMPDAPRNYQTKAKNAQEAHEAIRPTDLTHTPDEAARSLEPDQARLYELIWKRMTASQMASAELERTTVDIDAGQGRSVVLRATGQVIRFDGFLAAYQEGQDPELVAKHDREDDEGRLPPMNVGDKLSEHGIAVDQHFTEPPPRYTEATLIKKMEELGIGRPSTYAATLSVLRDRGYVRIEKKYLHPEDKGRLVTAFLESFFERYVEYDFTADLEEKLDKISAGDLSWKEVLRDFWRQFSHDVDETKELRVSEVLEHLNELLGPHIFPARADGGDARQCPNCGTGRLSLKLGKFGAFIGCSNYPECRYTRQLAVPEGETGEMGAEGKKLGPDPVSGLEVTLRSGRFGPYVQLGEAVGEEKPKRAGLPKGWEPGAMDLERALSLLALPRVVGPHPETGSEITAGIGRYGPFVHHETTYANLDSVDEAFSVGLNRAVSLLAEKAAGGRRARPGATVTKDLGDHPQGGGRITVRSGRYGPYVNYGKINATLPRGAIPEDTTMETAIALLAAKAEKGPSSGRRGKPTAARGKSRAAGPAKKNGAKNNGAEAEAARPKKRTRAKAKGAAEAN
jgi:DNA topoisomerase-1